MGFIQAIVCLIVLGIIYKKMIDKEGPSRISKAQAITPVILGIVSLPISFIFFIFIGITIKKITGYSLGDGPLLLGSFIKAFFGAGLNEEIAKMIMLLISVRIFKKKIRNVYGYILIGAGVGFGFTLLEEFTYGSSIITLLVRLIGIAGHMVFGMIMGEFIGLARYNKEVGNGKSRNEYVLALLVPLGIHTLYDTLVLNQFLNSTNDEMITIGICISFAGVVLMVALQIYVFMRFKKNIDRWINLNFANGPDITAVS